MVNLDIMEVPVISLDDDISSDSIVELEKPARSPPPIITVDSEEIDVVEVKEEENNIVINIDDSAVFLVPAVPGKRMPVQEIIYSDDYISPNHWTKDMKKYYNDDWEGEESFDLYKLQRKMSRDTRLWMVGRTPYPNLGRKRTPCFTCGGYGHQDGKCKPECCHMCGEEGHAFRKCPQSKCLSCGKRTHGFVKSCNRCCEKKRRNKCTRCKLSGHSLVDCTDHWRRFHDVTNLDGVKEPPISAHKPISELWCCNCARKGHLEVHCMKFHKGPFAPTSTLVTSYVRSFAQDVADGATPSNDMVIDKARTNSANADKLSTAIDFLHDAQPTFGKRKPPEENGLQAALGKRKAPEENGPQPKKAWRYFDGNAAESDSRFCQNDCKPHPSTLGKRNASEENGPQPKKAWRYFDGNAAESDSRFCQNDCKPHPSTLGKRNASEENGPQPKNAWRYFDANPTDPNFRMHLSETKPQSASGENGPQPKKAFRYFEASIDRTQPDLVGTLANCLNDANPPFIPPRTWPMFAAEPPAFAGSTDLEIVEYSGPRVHRPRLPKRNRNRRNRPNSSETSSFDQPIRNPRFSNPNEGLSDIPVVEGKPKKERHRNRPKGWKAQKPKQGNPSNDSQDQSETSAKKKARSDFFRMQHYKRQLAKGKNIPKRYLDKIQGRMARS